MATEIFVNGVGSTLLNPIGPTDTAITVQDGSQYPALSSQQLRCLIDDELILITARSGNVLTATRGIESTTAVAHSANASVVPVVTAAGIVQAINDLSVQAAEIDGAASTIAFDDLTASRVVVSDSSGKIAVSTVTNTELGYVSGVTSAIQDQLGDKADTSSLAAVATSGDYDDLSNTPSLAAVATSGAYSDLTGTPTLATVATSGDYDDLSNTPSLAAVATSGAYSDLIGTPTLGTASASDDSDYVHSDSDYANKPAYTNNSVYSSFAYDYANGRQQIITVTAHVASFSFSNTNNCTTPATLIINNPSGWNWNWSSAVKWPGGTVPTISTGTDVVTFIYDSVNSCYYGQIAQNFS